MAASCFIQKRGPFFVSLSRVILRGSVSRRSHGHQLFIPALLSRGFPSCFAGRSRQAAPGQGERRNLLSISHRLGLRLLLKSDNFIGNYGNVCQGEKCRSMTARPVFHSLSRRIAACGAVWRPAARRPPGPRRPRRPGRCPTARANSIARPRSRSPAEARRRSPD